MGMSHGENIMVLVIASFLHVYILWWFIRNVLVAFLDFTGHLEHVYNSFSSLALIVQFQKEDLKVGERLDLDSEWVQCQKCEKWRELPDGWCADDLIGDW